MYLMNKIMKQLIFLLLISVNVFGQIKCDNLDSLDCIIYRSLNHNRQYCDFCQKYFQREKQRLIYQKCITLQDLIDYQKECYNDSSLEHTHFYNRWYDDCYTQRGNLMDGYHYVLSCKDSTHFEWIHKQPTFEGFIEYLKNKK